MEARNYICPRCGGPIVRRDVVNSMCANGCVVKTDDLKSRTMYQQTPAGESYTIESFASRDRYFSSATTQAPPDWPTTAIDHEKLLASMREMQQQQKEFEQRQAIAMQDCEPCPHCNERPQYNNGKLIVCASFYRALLNDPRVNREAKLQHKFAFHHIHDLLHGVTILIKDCKCHVRDQLSKYAVDV